jgi:hypothetical protein
MREKIEACFSLLSGQKLCCDTQSFATTVRGIIVISHIPEWLPPLRLTRPTCRRHSCRGGWTDVVFAMVLHDPLWLDEDLVLRLADKDTSP